MAPVLERLVDAYPEAVQVTYRHFPLISIHDKAQKSSEAAEAAAAQGKFWEYHSVLYDQQADWAGLSPEDARDIFVDLASELGLDTDKFSSELDGDVYADHVTTLYEEATNIGLPGTPAIILNGRLLSGENTPRDFTLWANFVEDQIALDVALKELADRQFDAAPEININEDASYRARVKIESGDEFVIELLPKSAPLTVNNFIFLAKEGWFDGVTFHRVLPGFVAQTGDPSGTGMGDPGYTIPTEIDPNFSHEEAGIVAMANSGPDMNGSQWYITLGDVSQLDGSYTIFGRVVEGMDVVTAITPRENPGAPAGDKIISVVIEEE